MSAGHLYGTATVSDQATAILGNKYGDIINIHQATFLLQTTPTTQPENDPLTIVRHNRVLSDGQKTLEVITKYDDGSHFSRRGTTHQIEICWQRCENIGVGSFGEVHREQAEEHGKIKSRAVKVLRKRRLEHLQVDHKKELDALIDLSQPQYVHRFVEFYAWYESQDEIHLAMEYIPCGDLESYIQAGLNELDVRQIAHQVLDALRVMHRLDLVHRDIKPANIFVVQREPLWWVKVGDFSICKRSTTRQTILRTQVGTQGYQAPEVLGLVTKGKRDMYDSKCDIWSFGCLVFEMLTRQVPFPDIGDLNRYCNDEIPFPGLLIKESGGSFQIAEYTWSILQANPPGRPNADQAMFLLSYRCQPNAVAQEDPGGFDYLYLKDCMNRHFRLPWQYCSTWVEMRATLHTLCSYVERNAFGQRVSQGQYELKNASGTCLYPHNWEHVVVPGMCVFLGTQSEPQRQTSADIRLIDHAKHSPSTLSKSQHALNEPTASSNSPRKSSNAQIQSQALEPVSYDNPKSVADPAMEVIDHRALADRDQADTRVAPTDEDTRLCAVMPKPRLLQSIRDDIEFKLYHPTGTDSPSDPSQSSSEILHMQTEHDPSAASPSLAAPNDVTYIVKEEHTDHNAPRAREAPADAMSISDTYIPATQIGPPCIVPFGLTKKTQGLAQSFSLVECDDSDHGEDEVYFGDGACLRDEKVYTTCTEDESPTNITLLTAVWIPESAKPQNSSVVRVNCSKCVQRIPRGRDPCSSCKASQLERRESQVMLVDLEGNVYALPWVECRTWRTLRQFIEDCFKEDSWYPMIVRGYFHVVDLKRERTIVDSYWWEEFVSSGDFKTIGIEPWVKTWIYNLPPYLTLGQITSANQKQTTISAVADFQGSPLQTDSDKPIYLTLYPRYKIFIPWNEARCWEYINDYVEKLRSRQHYDLFISELKCQANAISWQQIRPGMHVYCLVYPDCSAALYEHAEGVGREMLQRLQTQETAAGDASALNGGTPIVIDSAATPEYGQIPEDEEKNIADKELARDSDHSKQSMARAGECERPRAHFGLEDSNGVYVGYVPYQYDCSTPSQRQHRDSGYDRPSIRGKQYHYDVTKLTERQRLRPPSMPTGRSFRRVDSPQFDDRKVTEKSTNKSLSPGLKIFLDALDRLDL